MVLIVDENADIADGLAVALRGEAINVQCVYSVRAARDFISRRVPSLIVLADSPTRLDGLELLGQIRNDDRFVTIPVIVYASRNDPERSKTATGLGISRWFLKGCATWFEIVEAVQGELEARGTEDG